MYKTNIILKKLSPFGQLFSNLKPIISAIRIKSRGDQRWLPVSNVKQNGHGKKPLAPSLILKNTIAVRLVEVNSTLLTGQGITWLLFRVLWRYSGYRCLHLTFRSPLFCQLRSRWRLLRSAFYRSFIMLLIMTSRCGDFDSSFYIFYGNLN